MKFNLQKYSSLCSFTCCECGSIGNYRSAKQGCSACNGFLFKVSFNRGTPLAFDPHSQEDVYNVKNETKRKKLTTPGSEEMNPSGFGGRNRDGLYTDEEDKERKQEIPGPYSSLIDNPPPSDGPSIDTDQKFTDPIDSLSLVNEINKPDEEVSLESKLRKSRSFGIYDDNRLKNPFKTVGKNLSFVGNN